MSENVIVDGVEVQAEMKHIELRLIKENPDALRQVEKTTEKYLGLVDSVRAYGVQQSILVRPSTDEHGNLIYGLVDGLHRFSASQDAGRKTIPAMIISMTDAEALERQMILNIHRLETKPVEYARQILRLAGQNPLMTTKEIGLKLKKSDTWIKDRLSLVKLSEDIQTLVDEGSMTLLNAYNLAKLKPEDQVNYLDRALTAPAEEFAGIVSVRVKEVRDADRQGRAAKPEEFVAVPRARKVTELEKELKEHNAARNSTNPEGFLEGIRFALMLDAETVQKAKDNWTAQKQLKDEETNRKKLETLKKKQEAAAKTAAEVQTALQALGGNVVAAQ
jgi:ParB/RepB/Spo0J family partition protein